MNFLVLLGIALLLLTYWEYRRDETDTVLIFEWWAWFDVSRASFPLFYWTILTVQAVAGVVLIIQGLSDG